MRVVVPTAVAVAKSVLAAAHCASGIPVEPPVRLAQPTVEPEEVWQPNQRRIALVLGAGGIPGVAWQAATLEGLYTTGQLALETVPLVIGTSAGALVALLLRCGLSPREIAELVADGEFREGTWAVTLPGAVQSAPDSNPWKSPSAHPDDAAGGPLGELRQELDHLWSTRHPEQSWPSRSTWIVATDAKTGARVVFGAPGEPRVTPGIAVAASCAVPLLLPPVRTDQRLFVDGGMASFTSMDLACMMEPDEIWVLDPATAPHVTASWNPRNLIVSATKRAHTVSIEREVQRARDNGLCVNLLTPSHDELQCMGADLLDISRCRQVVDVTRANWSGRAQATGR